VFGREMIPTDLIDVTTLVDYQVLMATVTWHREHRMHVLAVYAPNNPSDNSAFWDDLLTTIKERVLTKLDIILGDFNVMEDPQDRLLPHADDGAAIMALRSLTAECDVSDG
jgi:hypothetical protein